MDTTLHHFARCSASWRVRWALAIKGIPFTSVIVDILRGEHQTDEHRAKNPLSHVPALGIDGRCKLPLDTHTTKRLSSSQQTLDASE